MRKEAPCFVPGAGSWEPFPEAPVQRRGRLCTCGATVFASAEGVDVAEYADEEEPHHVPSGISTRNRGIQPDSWISRGFRDDADSGSAELLRNPWGLRAQRPEAFHEIPALRA